MAGIASGKLQPEVLRELALAPGVHPRGALWLSATSGLVCVQRHAYVVADDEYHLGHFALDRSEPLSLFRLFDGALPRDKGKRKKTKPDLECLARLPPFELYPHGALLALGSGSRATRNRATLLAFDGSGRIQGAPLVLDLAALYAPLRQQFGGLNVEGVFVDGQLLHLLQRGNKNSVNARISFDWHSWARWLLEPGSDAPQPVSVQLLDLGSVDGVPLTPTDAVALVEGRWLCCAVAENSDDSYNDGACLHSLICRADAHGHIERIWHLDGNPKVEGIALEPGTDPAGAELPVLLVTDADDPDIASQLIRVTLSAD
ncbi:MAG: DUF6929 family protein [Gammaproteobacteria bacterium]